MTHTYTDTCPKCGGDARTTETDTTKVVDCQELDCDWTDITAARHQQQSWTARAYGPIAA